MQSEDSYLKRARTNEALLTLKYPKTCTDLQTSNLKPRLGSESNSRINFKSYCCCTRICTSFESQGDWRSPRTTANSNMFLLSHTHTHTHTHTHCRKPVRCLRGMKRSNNNNKTLSCAGLGSSVAVDEEDITGINKAETDSRGIITTPTVWIRLSVRKRATLVTLQDASSEREGKIKSSKRTSAVTTLKACTKR